MKSEFQSGVVFRLSACQLDRLTRYLYPGDWRESVAVGTCLEGVMNMRRILRLQRLVAIPPGYYQSRHFWQAEWNLGAVGERLVSNIRRGYIPMCFHSHPCGCRQFSPDDEIADRSLQAAIGTRLNQSCSLLAAEYRPNGKLTRITNLFIPMARSFAVTRAVAGNRG